jgi:hypothetical protein
MGGKSAAYKVVPLGRARNGVGAALKRCRIFEPENRFPLFLKML